jgi:hypothetical protein
MAPALALVLHETVELSLKAISRSEKEMVIAR